jgi:hypothetical protein
MFISWPGGETELTVHAAGGPSFEMSKTQCQSLSRSFRHTVM